MTGRAVLRPTWRRTIARTSLDGLRLLGRHLPDGRRPEPDSLRILGHVHRFLPGLRGGAQISFAGTLRSLVERGHRVELIVDDPDGAGTAEIGYGALTAPSRAETWRAYRRADVVLTQLDARARALRLAGATGRPLVHFVHTSHSDLHTDRPTDLRVFAAEWPTRTRPGERPFLVVHPSIDAADYEVPRGDAITLVNLSALKGADLFYRLVAALPDHRFLGVRGAWGDQIVPDVIPENLEIVPLQADIRTVFRQTRVLLLPSREELLPRIGLEAACSGIPTIASPLPGVIEGLGDAALLADADDLDAWIDRVRSLDDRERYDARSTAARARVAALAEARHGEIDRLESALCDLARGDAVRARENTFQSEDRH